MTERADQLLKEEEELNKRRDALLFAPKDPDKAHEMGEELLDILKKKDALNKRAEKELARRKKIDNVCIPIIIIGFLTFLISGIISLIGLFKNGSFSPTSGIIAIIAICVVVIDVVIMKLLNPDMKIF